ncbi:hypothetical protein GGQ72_000229 [Rhizobium rhizoryzae]|uniref:Uncharacterized protein n=1 Tax=Rhizobium rhizoryzae TaxID=451876 RepID=A0A7W6PNA0_9HYPH|nr:hypothetical protein [Rhizobium rhizoryzae]
MVLHANCNVWKKANLIAKLIFIFPEPSVKIPDFGVKLQSKFRISASSYRE